MVTASVPNDYRQRHPIAVQEANHSIVVFVGAGRGGLSVPQRTDVAGFGQGDQGYGQGGYDDRRGPGAGGRGAP